MGVRSAIGAARTDPAEAEREALAKLEQELAEQYQERNG